jgi:sodium/hydrogen exchanger-like protein 6/7
MYAFVGTLLSSFSIGGLLWAATAIPGTGLHAFSALDALLTGTVLSATDTVAVIAVFDALAVDRELYALVFGESVLNDAVAIVLYRTLAGYQRGDVTAASVFRGVGSFLLVFLGSMALGVLVGVLAALLFKHVRMRRDRAGLEVEKALLAVVPFISYM